MRRILLFITDLEIGGTPTVVRELALRLREPGKVEIEVACLGRWGPVADQLQQYGVKVTALGARKQTDFKVIRKLIELIRQRNYDTVFSFLIHANAAAAYARWECPNVRFIQSIQTTQSRPRWHWLMQRVVHRAAETIVVPSESVANVAQIRSHVPVRKIVVIPNAVDIPERQSAAIPERKTIHVGFLGRLDPIKRVPDLVRAVGLLDPIFVLDIYGEGEARGAIEEEVKLLGLASRVTLHGRTDLPMQAIQSFDLLVLPSEAEGAPMVIIEAMAARVPVVGTNVPGIRDAISHEQTGMLVPAHGIHEMAQTIRLVSTDVELRQRLVTNAFEDVRKRFSWEMVLTRYRQVLNIDDQS